MHGRYWFNVCLSTNLLFLAKLLASQELNKSSTAIVMPFTRCQFHAKVKRNLLAWNNYPPCNPLDTRELDMLGELTLIFHFNGDAAQDSLPMTNMSIEHALWDLWSKLVDLKQCFRGGFSVVSAKLTPLEDAYPLGTCIMFFNIFSVLKDRGFDHMFQMEPDVTPIKAGWGVRLLKLTSRNRDCQEWWQQGSTAMYTNPIDFELAISNTVDMHLNGNSIYCVESTEFELYRASVIEFFPPYGCGDPSHGFLDGYDHAMYRFRAKPENKHLMKYHYSKFHASDLILNFGQSKFKVEDVHSHSPGTFFVHGKSTIFESKNVLDEGKSFEHFSRQVKLVFYSELGRFPSSSEIQFLWSGRRNIVSFGDEALAEVLGEIFQIFEKVKGVLEYARGWKKTFNIRDRYMGQHMQSMFRSKYCAWIVAHYMGYTETIPETVWSVREDGRIACSASAGKIVRSDIQAKCMERGLQLGKLHLRSPCRLLFLFSGSWRMKCKEVTYNWVSDSLTASCKTEEGSAVKSKLEDVHASCRSKVYLVNGQLACERPPLGPWPVSFSNITSLVETVCNEAKHQSIVFLDRHGALCKDGILQGFRLSRCHRELYRLVSSCLVIENKPSLSLFERFTRCHDVGDGMLSNLKYHKLDCGDGFLQHFILQTAGCPVSHQVRFLFTCVLHSTFIKSSCSSLKILPLQTFKMNSMDALEYFKVSCEPGSLLKAFQYQEDKETGPFFELKCCSIHAPPAGHGWNSTVGRPALRNDSSFRDTFLQIYRGTNLTGSLFLTGRREANKVRGLRYNVLSTDFHASPIACNLPVLYDLGLNIDARIDFGNCIFFKDKFGKDLCANKNPLKGFSFDSWRGFGLDPCPNLLRERFFEEYKATPEFSGIDFFLCSHPVANCELYLPFNRSVILYATTRLEFGRLDSNIDWRKPYISNHSISRWEEWLNALQKIAARPRNIVAANNMYDVAYIEYFAGVEAIYVPSWCGPNISHFQDFSYAPTQVEVLIVPYRTNLDKHPDKIPTIGWPEEIHSGNVMEHPILKDLIKANFLSGSSIVFKSMESAFNGHYTHISQLRDYPALVFLPYQASTMSFFEFYRLSIPILVPSKALLLKWVHHYGILWERSYGNPPRPTNLPLTKIPDPNSNDLEAMGHWMQFYDIYQEETFPHLLYFESWEDAHNILMTTDLANVAKNMFLHNTEEYYRIKSIWKRLLEASAARIDLPRRPVASIARASKHNESISAALWVQFGLTFNRSDTGSVCESRWKEWNEKYQLYKESDGLLEASRSHC